MFQPLNHIGPELATEWSNASAHLGALQDLRAQGLKEYGRATGSMGRSWIALGPENFGKHLFDRHNFTAEGWTSFGMKG